MSEHYSPFNDPLRMDSERFACNGQPPNPIGFQRLADGFNHIIGRRMKVVMCRAANLASVPGGTANTGVWPTYFRTGDAQTAFAVYAGLGQSDTSSATPYFQVSVYTASSEVVFAENVISYNGQQTGTGVTLSEISHVSTLVEGLTANTEYYAFFEGFNGVRPVYVLALLGGQKTVDTAVTPVCDPTSAVAEAPIYDLDMGRLVTASNNLWRHNGTHLMAWACNYDSAAAPATVATGYTDLLTGTADTRKFTIAAQYHTTLMRTTLPVKLAVKAERTAGAGTCDVRLYDGTNSIAVTGIDQSKTDNWYTAPGTIPAATTTTWQIQALAQAGSTFEIQSVVLFPFET